MTADKQVLVAGLAIFPLAQSDEQELTVSPRVKYSPQTVHYLYVLSLLNSSVSLFEESHASTHCFPLADRTIGHSAVSA